MRITAAGNVGIGTTSPIGARLMIYGTSFPNFIVNGGTSSLEMVVNTSTPYNTVLRSTGGRLDLEAPGNYPRLTIDGGTGNVGIGTVSPSGTMDIYRNAGAGGNTQLNIISWAGGATSTNTSKLNLKIQGAGAGGVDNTICGQFIDNGVGGMYGMTFNPSGAFKMAVTDWGVGIGTSVPNATLHVNGNALISGVPYTYSTSIASVASGVNTTTAFIATLPTTATFLVNAHGVTNGYINSSGMAMVSCYYDGGSGYFYTMTSIAVSNFSWVSISQAGTITFQQTTGAAGTFLFNALKIN